MSTLLTLSLLASAPATGGDDVLASIERQEQKLFEKIAPSVVLITNGEGLGSGFFVNDDGLILTNAHVVGMRTKVEVTTYDGRKLKGAVIERGADDIDVALVKVTLADSPALVTADVADHRVASWVGSVGHGAGTLWTFNSGIISNLYSEGAERPVFQTQIPLNPGNSGGPIFDRQGRVIGIVTSGITAANAINFGIAMELARRSLKGLADACECVTLKAPKGVPIFVDGTMVGVGPRVVYAIGDKRSFEAFSIIDGQRHAARVEYPKQRELSFP